MARIRSIKPEFPQSESMGRVSRDARLLFVMLWPICDDHGRTRAASRMLASLLFPYDDDAPNLIDGWLDELEREDCIRRYEANGSTFLVVRNWLNHQKIDKPSKAQFPDPPEQFANPREGSGLEGKGGEGKGKEGILPTAGAEAPNDPDPIFGTGLAFLIRKGIGEKGARSFLGAMRKEVRDDLVVIELLIEAERQDVSDPLAWLRAAGRKRSGQAIAGARIASGPKPPPKREFPG